MNKFNDFEHPYPALSEKNMNKFNDFDHRHFPALSGKDIVNMMRKNHVTIFWMAKVNDIFMKRIRELRTDGVPAGFASWEIHWMIEETKNYSNPTVHEVLDGIQCIGQVPIEGERNVS
jgi:hypothetical protein